MAGSQQHQPCEFEYDLACTQQQTGYHIQSTTSSYNDVPHVSNSNPVGIVPQDVSSQQLIPPIVPFVMPLTVRISVLNLRFMKLQDSTAKSQIRELQSFYFLKSADLESERFSSLSCTTANYCMQSSTNNYFDQEHHTLINRVEHSLKLIEERIKHATKQTCKRPSSKSDEMPRNGPLPPKSSTMNPVALRIMNNWYERNSEHPYPSYETAEVMAKAGDVSVEQVKKWFANRRLRLGDTKHITDIAKRRKRSRTVSRDDVMLLGCLKSE